MGAAASTGEAAAEMRSAMSERGAIVLAEVGTGRTIEPGVVRPELVPVRRVAQARVVELRRVLDLSAVATLSA
jgi:hypothetical protein